jgi:hypothetical protein
MDHPALIWLVATLRKLTQQVKNYSINQKVDLVAVSASGFHRHGPTTPYLRPLLVFI